MKAETIENILNFLKEKESKEIPERWSIVEKLETHPDDIQYKHNGNLILLNRKITKLPNDLYVDGKLFIIETDITELPNKLYVDGTLSLKGCNQLTELPDNLHVGESLDLRGTNISEIPNNLYVGIHLFIYDTPLADKYTDEDIRKMIRSKGGTIKGIIIRK